MKKNKKEWKKIFMSKLYFLYKWVLRDISVLDNENELYSNHFMRKDVLTYL